FASDSIYIIPQPVKVVAHEGSFILPGNVTISVNTGVQEVVEMVNQFSTQLKQAAGYSVSVNNIDAKNSSSIHLLLNKKNEPVLGDEGYELEVNAEGVFIKANRPAGLFYGLKTLNQLLPKEIESRTLVPGKEWKIPFVNITDYPRFKWRGMMFDVSRHFFYKAGGKRFYRQHGEI
ncbi:MAG: beta-N-acetylhexosaminidase, partial [Ginsengibacter sp.]